MCVCAAQFVVAPRKMPNGHGYPFLRWLHYLHSRPENKALRSSTSSTMNIWKDLDGAYRMALGQLDASRLGAGTFSSRLVGIEVAAALLSPRRASTRGAVGMVLWKPLFTLLLLVSVKGAPARTSCWFAFATCLNRRHPALDCGATMDGLSPWKWFRLICPRDSYFLTGDSTGLHHLVTAFLPSSPCTLS